MTSRRTVRPVPAAVGAVLAAALLAACSATIPTAQVESPTVRPQRASPAPSSATASDTASPSPSASSIAAPTGVYAHTGAGMLNPTAQAARPLVYVPNNRDDTVDVIDPATFTVVDQFTVGREPQHVVPSWDMKTLWVNDDLSNDLYPIDPATGTIGDPVPVDDPYNLYFTPDGRSAMVMAERLRRIDFRDPHTMKLQHQLDVDCAGVNHADFSADGSFFIASCEFSGELIVVPTDGSAVRSRIDLNAIKTPGATDAAAARHHGGPAAGMEPGVTAMPQDVRLSADGSTFLVADMMRNGVWLVDAKTQRQTGFVPTGKGAHSVYPSRDASVLYVGNRDGGTVSVLDGETFAVLDTWQIPGGGSPDMGGVTADGSQLWLSGRYDAEVYVFDTSNGKLLHRIEVGNGAHGLCVWPQPGRYSLGHTGNTR